MSFKKKVRIEKSRYYNHYQEDDNYMHRIKMPVVVLLVIVLVAIFILFWRLFGLAV